MIWFSAFCRIFFFFVCLLGIHHCEVATSDHIENLKQDFCMVFLFMYSCVFGLLFWFDFSFLICSCNNLSCICSDCSFFSRFLISLILLLPSTASFCSSTSSNNFHLLTTSSGDTVRLVKQNLRSFGEWVPNINSVFMCLSLFSKLHLLAIDLKRLQNCFIAILNCFLKFIYFKSVIGFRI